MSPVVKFLLYFPKLYLELKPAQCPGVVDAVGLGLPSVIIPGVLRRGWQHLGVSPQVAVGNVLLCSSCFPELRDFTFSSMGNGILLRGRQSYESLQFFVPQVSVVQ